MPQIDEYEATIAATNKVIAEQALELRTLRQKIADQQQAMRVQVERTLPLMQLYQAEHDWPPEMFPDLGELAEWATRKLVRLDEERMDANT